MECICAKAVYANHRLWRCIIYTTVALVAVTFTTCSGNNKSGNTPILLFNGTGTSPNDVAAIETVLNTNGLNYTTANAEQLNAMAEPVIKKYRLLIMPGGDFIEMGNSLHPGTAANIRKAVTYGLNYLGICAGGFLAGKYRYYNGFNLASGVTFGFYSIENKGIRKAAVAISSTGCPTLEQYWEDGPQFTGWGAVVGRYPDGTPAIAEGTFGRGFVILAGVHPEAPEAWRHGMTFNTPAGEDNAFAGKLIRAALNGTSLPHY
jgi:glutamine amidotransferase-like uncharacterized protein